MSSCLKLLNLPLLYSILWIIFLVQLCSGANILFFFAGANYSHKHSVWPLVRELVNKNHSVTFITSSEKRPFSIEKLNEIIPSSLKKASDVMYTSDRIKDRIENKLQHNFQIYESYSFKICELFFNQEKDEDGQVENLLQNSKFDLVVVNTIYGECGFLLAHHFKAKSILFDSTTILSWFHGIYGIPVENSWVPNVRSLSSFPMNFYDRLRGIYYLWVEYTRGEKFQTDMMSLYYKRVNKEEENIKFIDLQRKIGIALVNIHYTTDFQRSLPPMFINVGGMMLWEPVDDLPEQFRKYIDEAEDGVFLISFGSTFELNQLDEKYIRIFFNMMRKFDKIRFIWRWNGPLPPNSPKNLMASKWLPQTSIIREKSVRGFMTHCGANGLMEAVYYGVPLLGMPLFVDQDFLAYRIESLEIGIKIEVKDFSDELLQNAVGEILNNPKYKRNVDVISKLFRDRPNPTKVAYEAVEFVLRHDDLSSLKPMELHQNFIIRNNLDVFFAFLLIVFILPLLLIFIMFKILKR